MEKNNFISTKDELLLSVREFFNKPEFWKSVVGAHPKYFIHVNFKGKHMFALSKFCAFRNITVEEYLSFYRREADGGTTQKHIVKITSNNWIPRNKSDESIVSEFDTWISSFFPNYNVNNANFISLSVVRNTKYNKQSKLLSPQELEKKLKHQSKIGRFGEVIAYEYEKQRLKNIGIKNPDNYITHISKNNVSAGYDIYSSTRYETRYIEVKSSLNKNSDFFITENEIYTLETLKEEAFIYFVHITDLDNKKGIVLKEISDPIKKLKDRNLITPIAYKVKTSENLD